MEKQIDNLEFPEQRILEVNMGEEVKRSFLDYSMSVIIARALPDVRDGLKPVHRRILYSMYTDHLTYNNPYRKSATTVGNVLGHYHPHGDAAVYDTMVRMAQWFSLRYPLIDGQGNFGTLDGDQAAAYRYTEARMTRFAGEMLTDIDKDVVDFTDNFDNKLKEPTVLPARFPNLLVNGSIGIAVGMATNIPTHNLGEVIDGTIYLMEHPDCEITDLIQFVKGPDFPTGATIYGSNGILSAYTTGRGRVIVRAKADIDEDKHRIIVTEIPYMVNKSSLVESIAECHKEKKVEGITGLRDESSLKTGVRIVVEYRHDANGQIILNQLYKYTQLQDTCAMNMLALVDNVPRVLNLKQILEYYIKHQREVIRRRTEFELKRAKHDAHIYEGYKIAADNIDEVVQIIKASPAIPEAKANLMERFALSDEQAQAIVDMTLGRLSGMERQKVEERLAKLYETIKELEGILADPEKIDEIIKTDLTATKERYGDARKTELVPVHDEIMLEDLIERHTCVITMTHGGYIKRRPSDSYSVQNRGGKGLIGMSTKEEDFVETLCAVNSHSYLLMFTNTGKVHVKKAYQIPESGRTAKGTHIMNLLELEADEKITAMIAVGDFCRGEYLTMVTRRGIIKRTDMTEYENRRKGGKIALTLDEGDELLFVRHTFGDGQMIIATEGGNAARFDEAAVRIMGRTARGVRGIRLTGDDLVCGVAVVDPEKSLLTITENGYGKRTPFDEYTAHSRGTKGVCCHRINEKTGLLCGIAAVDDTDDIMLITNEGTLIRIPVSQIPTYSRAAGGVIVMRTAADQFIVNFARVDHEDEEEVIEESENTEGENTPDGGEDNAE